MKRLINAGSLADKLRTRKVMSGEKAVQDAYETAMWDALNEPEVTLNALRDEVYEDAVAHGLWEDTDRYADEMGEDETEKTMFAHVEAVKKIFFEADEALEAAENSNIEGMIDELADVIIQVLSTSGYLGIDIDAAVRRKVAYNKTRPWKHGKE